MSTIDYSAQTPVNGNNTNDIIEGTSGDDVIIAGPAVAQTYTTTNPQGKTQTHDINDNDLITGGLGDDVMSGGYGNDTFVFNFTVKKVTTEAISETFSLRDAPGVNADFMAWQNYAKEVKAWYDQLVGQHGADESDDAISFLAKLSGGSAKKAAVYGAVDFDLTYFKAGEETLVVEGEGYDTILDWNNGNDTLQLAGLSNDAAADNYWGKHLTFDTVADGKTVISFNGGSITLVGVDTTMEALLAAEQVSWG